MDLYQRQSSGKKYHSGSDTISTLAMYSSEPVGFGINI